MTTSHYRIAEFIYETEVSPKVAMTDTETREWAWTKLVETLIEDGLVSEEETQAWPIPEAVRPQ